MLKGFLVSLTNVARLRRASMAGLLVLATAPMAHADRALEALQPALVPVTPNRIFSPLGFDDNDNAQIVLDGELSDTCYKLGPTQFKVDEVHQRIYVQQQAYYYPGAWCAQVRVPYTQTVNLGLLAAGQYELVVQSEDGSLKPISTLPVALSSTRSPDDFLYAPVSDVYLEKSLGAFEGRESFYTLYINGHFNTSCMKFKEVKMHTRPNGVIEVLPIVEMDRTVPCSQIMTDFNVGVSLKDVPKGRYLLHIRSLNGQAVNRIVDL